MQKTSRCSLSLTTLVACFGLLSCSAGSRETSASPKGDAMSPSRASEIRVASAAAEVARASTGEAAVTHTPGRSPRSGDDAPDARCLPRVSFSASSPLLESEPSERYSLEANGVPLLVEELSLSPDTHVHYAEFAIMRGCAATIVTTLDRSFSSYALVPSNEAVSVVRSVNTLTFTSGPNYLVLKVDGNDLLFILIEEQAAQSSNAEGVGRAQVSDLGGDLAWPRPLTDLSTKDSGLAAPAPVEAGT